MPHIVRPAVDADIPLLQAFDASAKNDPRRMHEIAQAVRDNSCWVVVDNVPIAYATVHTHFFQQAFVELLIVSAAHRRKGLGAVLLQAIEEALRAPGRKLFTSTNQSNAPMRALVQKMGYKPAGQVDGLDAGDPELFFMKVL